LGFRSLQVLSNAQTVGLADQIITSHCDIQTTGGIAQDRPHGVIIAQLIGSPITGNGRSELEASTGAVLCRT
jgi:hypothetical protein